MFACFLSYAHPKGGFVQAFVDQLKDALTSYLDLYVNEGLCIDREYIQPGDEHEKRLAQAICQSVCMVVVYFPRYEEQPYCLREFEAMKRVELRRRQAGAALGAGKRMIIPVILRQDADEALPPEISKLDPSDFSKFSTASRNLAKNPTWVAEIERIVGVIKDHHKALQKAKAQGIDICSGCEAFDLPSEAEIVPWRGGQQKPVAAFPLREPSP